MATIIIKKRVTLEFLGEEYKDSYLEFKSLSLAEFEKLLVKLEPNQDNNKESIKLIAKVLEDQFISGKFLAEDVVKEDIRQFDLETLTRSFELFTGQRTDPKVEKP